MKSFQHTIVMFVFVISLVASYKSALALLASYIILDLLAPYFSQIRSTPVQRSKTDENKFGGEICEHAKI